MWIYDHMPTDSGSYACQFRFVCMIIRVQIYAFLLSHRWVVARDPASKRTSSEWCWGRHLRFVARTCPHAAMRVEWDTSDAWILTCNAYIHTQIQTHTHTHAYIYHTKTHTRTHMHKNTNAHIQTRTFNDSPGDAAEVASLSALSVISPAYPGGEITRVLSVREWIRIVGKAVWTDQPLAPLHNHIHTPYCIPQ